jgi:hypothetical protein
MSGITKTLTLSTSTGELPVVVRELGVEDIRNHLLSIDAAVGTGTVGIEAALDLMLFDDWDMGSFEVFTDLTVAAIREHNIAPSELERVIGTARAMNRFFFEMLPRLASAAQAARSSDWPASSATSPT